MDWIFFFCRSTKESLVGVFINVFFIYKRDVELNVSNFSGYRDDSLNTVKQNRDDYEMPLKILSYQDLYGWTMDAIVKQVF